MLIKRMSNLLFVSIALAASAGYVYRAEIFDMVYDSLASNEAAIKRKWLPENGGRFMLRPERNDVSFLRIGALRTGAPNSLGVPVSFELTNLGDANDFPNIAVFLVGADGKPVRHLVFSPSEYSHDSQFKQQHVELLVQPRPDEQRFTVQVFYGVRP
jgi:hypothetical protein